MYYFIFKRPNNTYYFKLKNYGYLLSHHIGYTNQYGHEIVLIISIPRAYHINPIKRLLMSLIRKIIKVLENIINKLG